MPQINDDVWAELEVLLNRVADEREQDHDGSGSCPTYNSYRAQAMIKKLEMERRKAVGLA